MLELIDSHSHLDVEDFDQDRDAVVQRARDAGVSRQVVPAIAHSGWNRLAAICRHYSGLYPAYGLHPLYLQQHQPAHLDELDNIIERERPVAVGECGLDHHIEGLDPSSQLYYFEAQLKLAGRHDLPLIVHARQAVDEVTACIRRHAPLRGVVHSFSGSLQQAQQLWKLGFCIGIGGPVTYERARRLREIVAHMPIEFLLLETDSPDQPMHGYQGQRNEPALLPQVLASVAGLRGESQASVAAATCANAVRLFGLA